MYNRFYSVLVFFRCIDMKAFYKTGWLKNMDKF